MAHTHVRTARGVIHALTIDRTYTDQGRRLSNLAGQSIGKADCGSITSGAGIVTDEPVNCPRCLMKNPGNAR